jgi:activator of HSP90 ATPase
VCRAAESRDSISRAAESIHQEPTFGAKRARVYRALTDAAEYDKVMSLSEAVKSKAVEAKPAEIDARAGGAFSLFGGYISGRFIELVPDELIVQAWRVGSWRRGSYSIARYQLEDDAGLTRILFDHAGFPAGQADHLAAGWYANYWSPLTQYLG